MITDIPVEDIFLHRWSPRAFAKQAVADRDLKAIFSAGGWLRHASTSSLGGFWWAQWRFNLDTNLGSTYRFNKAWASSAPVLYASFAKRTFALNSQPNRVAQHDIGAASGQMALQATALGLYVHGMVGFDPENLRSSFHVPDDFESVACLALGYRGYPDALSDRLKPREAEPRQRKSLSVWVFSECGQPAL